MDGWDGAENGKKAVRTRKKVRDFRQGPIMNFVSEIEMGRPEREKRDGLSSFLLLRFESRVMEERGCFM